MTAVKLILLAEDNPRDTNWPCPRRWKTSIFLIKWSCVTTGLRIGLSLPPRAITRARLKGNRAGVVFLDLKMPRSMGWRCCAPSKGDHNLRPIP